MQPGEQPVGGDELVVGTELGEAPAGQHGDPVGAADGGEAVRHDERRAARMSRVSASCTTASDSLSSADVASSMERTDPRPLVMIGAGPNRPHGGSSLNVTRVTGPCRVVP